MERKVEMNHNFQLVNLDTDSISFTDNGRNLSKEERFSLLNEINAQMPEYIKFEDDGYFSKVIVLRVKNYVLYDGKKITIKGSALKDAKSPKAIKEFQRKIVDSMLYDKNDYSQIYNEYVKEIWNISSKDGIQRWSKKYTISDKTLKSERTNETKVVDAIASTEYVEGDRVYLFFKQDTSLCLVERFSEDYDKHHLLKSLYNSTKIFENVLPEGMFSNYSLVKSQENLYSLLGLVYEKPMRKKKNDFTNS